MIDNLRKEKIHLECRLSNQKADFDTRGDKQNQMTLKNPWDDLPCA